MKDKISITLVEWEKEGKSQYGAYATEDYPDKKYHLWEMWVTIKQEKVMGMSQLQVIELFGAMKERKREKVISLIKTYLDENLTKWVQE